jgi:hypothetical protein
MPDTLEDLQARLSALETRIEQEWEARRAAMHYRIERGRVIFEDNVRAAHRRARVRLWAFLRRTNLLVVLTAPVIYAGIVPFVLLDLFVSSYQAICFPVYRIQKVRRRDHIVFDRQYLSYLNALQKFNCLYCAYGNGVISYAREIAGRTEKYWCPIKHASRVKGTHRQYCDFCDYGDAEGFCKGQEKLRKELRHIKDA